MKLLEKILFATDFSQAADSALQMAISIAKTFKSELILIHVLPEIKDSPLASDRVVGSAAKRLKEIQDTINRNGISVSEPITPFGSAFDQIIQCANNYDVNVIIIGSGEKTRGDKFPLGITAEKLIRHANQPVWVVKKGASPTIKKILCPVDFSEPSHRALTNAIQLSRNFHTDLAILTVIEPLQSVYGKKIDTSGDIQKIYAKNQNIQFAQFLRDFDFDNVSWNKVTRQGAPDQEILKQIWDTKPDLLIMGSEGRTGLARLLWGSVAEKVIREMPCSVITVKWEDVFRLRLETQITDIETHFKHGQELLEKGIPEEAVCQFEYIVSKDMMFAPAWEGLADAHSRLNHKEKSKYCREMAKQIRRTL
jgi:nucleotide-binding universal stress UspA family protein